ncbi:NADH-quinone oxidoreductase subunit NuoK [candidate division BRC1 bacterium HGW-BRC1-1]|jgi:NADH-quinone oxidoreductase subunit K|nr:MAG: NADH-quinone oxidoreductase subunit NuoK [candidate division BRC1 bacterium HGW-BRC1-1]
MTLPINEALILSCILFSIGVLGVVVRRNIIYVLMCIEIMMNAAGLAFVAASARHGSLDGQAFFLFVLPVAAAEVAIGLAIALLIFQRYKTLDLWVVARTKEA